jgi:hypothetical protein
VCSLAETGVGSSGDGETELMRRIRVTAKQLRSTAKVQMRPSQ